MSYIADYGSAATKVYKVKAHHLYNATNCRCSGALRHRESGRAAYRLQATPSRRTHGSLSLRTNSHMQPRSGV